MTVDVVSSLGSRVRGLRLRMPQWPASRGWAIAWVMVGALTLAMLCVPPASVGDSLGIRRFKSPEVTSTSRIGQRFRMDARNFSALEIHADEVGTVGGTFRLTVSDASTGDVIRSADVDAADLVRDDTYVLRFAPIEFSADRWYQFEIAPSPERPGRGVALWATKGPQLPEGGLLINGTPRWASLAFEASTTATAPILGLFGARDAGRPPRWLALIGLAGGWVALRWVLRGVAELSSERILAR